MFEIEFQVDLKEVYLILRELQKSNGREISKDLMRA